MGKNATPSHVNKVMNEAISEGTKVPSTTEAIKSLKIDIQMPFIDADAYVADPYALLGQVFQVRKVNGKCPATLTESGVTAEFTPYPVPRKINEASKLTKPSLRESIVVDRNLASSVAFLNYLSASLDASSCYSLIVFDQASGVIDMQDKNWRSGLDNWKKENKDLIDDDEICYLFAVAGFVQKNIVRKKYTKYTGKSKGGAFGLNINGELSTSTDDYSLDIKFGLTPIVIDRPKAAGGAMGIASTDLGKSLKPSKAEAKLFCSIAGTSLVTERQKQLLLRK